MGVWMKVPTKILFRRGEDDGDGDMLGEKKKEKEKEKEEKMVAVQRDYGLWLESGR